MPMCMLMKLHASHINCTHRASLTLDLYFIFVGFVFPQFIHSHFIFRGSFLSSASCHSIASSFSVSWISRSLFDVHIYFPLFNWVTTVPASPLFFLSSKSKIKINWEKQKHTTKAKYDEQMKNEKERENTKRNEKSTTTKHIIYFI